MNDPSILAEDSYERFKNRLPDDERMELEQALKREGT